MYKSLVIGLGNIGLTYDLDPKRRYISSHTVAYVEHPAIELVAASDVDEDKYSVLKVKSPQTVFYLDYKAMLKDHKVDVVSICTPPTTHLQIIQDVLEYNSPKLIFCEKPVVSDVDESRILRKIMGDGNCILIPNISRRWSSGLQKVKEILNNHQFGKLTNIHVRYTRGIHNTGSHMFDLIHMLAGYMTKVFTIRQVETSSDGEQDPSYSFHFETDQLVTGFAEAMDDRMYYMFEFDLYCTQGKIEIRMSGDEIIYYRVDQHPLFSGFRSLVFHEIHNHLLEQSLIERAISHMVGVLDGVEESICNFEDGLYPIYIAEAVQRSFYSHCWQEVAVY